MKPIVKIRCSSWLYDGSRLAIYVNIEVKNFKEYFEIGGTPIVGNGKYDLYFLYKNQGKSPLTVLSSAAEQVGFKIKDIHKLKEEIFCFVEYKDGKKNYHTICSSLEEIMAIAKCIAKSACIPVIDYEIHNVGIDGINVYDNVIEFKNGNAMKLNDRVIMRNTTSNELDGKLGPLMGIARKYDMIVASLMFDKVVDTNTHL